MFFCIHGFLPLVTVSQKYDVYFGASGLLFFPLTHLKCFLRFLFFVFYSMKMFALFFLLLCWDYISPQQMEICIYRWRAHAENFLGFLLEALTVWENTQQLLLMATTYSQAFKHTSKWTARMLRLIYREIELFVRLLLPGSFHRHIDPLFLVFARNIKKFLWIYKTLYYCISTTFLSLFFCTKFRHNLRSICFSLLKQQTVSQPLSKKGY